MEKRPEDARPYLFKAVRNRCLNAMRGSSRLTSLSEDQDGAEWLVKPAGMAEGVLDVEEAMRGLAPEQGEGVVRRIWGRRRLGGATAMLETPENTAGSRYRR